MRRVHLAAALLLGSALCCGPAHARPGSASTATGQAGSTVSFKTARRRTSRSTPEAWAASSTARWRELHRTAHTEHKEYPHPELAAATARDYTLSHYTPASSATTSSSRSSLTAFTSRRSRAHKEGRRLLRLPQPAHPEEDHRRGRKLLPGGPVGIPRTCARCTAKSSRSTGTSVHGHALVDGISRRPHLHRLPRVHDIGPSTAAFRLASPRLCADCHTGREEDGESTSSRTQVLRNVRCRLPGSTVTSSSGGTPIR